ncbi:MAG TPA: hypothetical protein VEA37_14485, partial [Flavobacterium sp.]|nr:hypothetical protein [Flavobacterium sp.]
IFPGLQGGPHNHQTAAIATALLEASTPEFADYGRQIVTNAKALAESLKQNDIALVGNGTENHLILMDLVSHLGPGGGVFAQMALEEAGMTVNKNTIPKDPSSPFYPSGVRLGTPALTTRGMKEPEMQKIGMWIGRAVKEISSYRLPVAKEERASYIAKFESDVKNNSALKQIRAEVMEMCKTFPIPGIE